MDKQNTYLKIVDNKVEAYGDLETAEFFETIHKSGRVYDKIIPSEEWTAVGCAARIVDGEIVLGLSNDEQYEKDAEIIRFERDERLKECDAISPMRWNSMSEEEQLAWTNYRINLLNIPQQDGFPWNGDVDKVPWPERPK